jgi:hypothetical protein
MGGRVAEIDLEFGVRSQSTPKDQLHVWARPTGTHRHAALEGKLGHQGLCAAFFDQVGMPLVQRDSRSAPIDPLRRRFSGDQAGFTGPTAPARPGRHRRGGVGQPDLRVVRHFGKIPAPQRRNPVQKSTISPERDLFELSYATRLNSAVGLYFGVRP